MLDEQSKIIYLYEGKNQYKNKGLEEMKNYGDLERYT